MGREHNIRRFLSIRGSTTLVSNPLIQNVVEHTTPC
jgi:hypothetical protein